MELLSILPRYVGWHYSLAIRDLSRNLRNLLAFLGNFFSFSVLITTLFAPWERMSEGYARGLEPGQWFETFIINSVLRFVGFVVRSVTLLFGLAVFLTALALTALFFLLWLVAPLVVLFLFALGLIRLL
ncbi:hypothetical protein EPN83_00490 [Patescibacteria group bacterium]|nr:MAG: hypothetical protein EPN83_00490 [Patescibacteria group bacterium]